MDARNKSGHDGVRVSAFRFRIRVDHRTGPVLLGPKDRLPRAVAKLFDIAGRDVLELAEDGARLRPLAIAAERDIARDRLEGGRMDVFRDPVVIEALRLRHRLRELLRPGSK